MTAKSIHVVTICLILTVCFAISQADADVEISEEQRQACTPIGQEPGTTYTAGERLQRD